MPDNEQKTFHIENQADIIDIDSQLDIPKVREAVKAIMIELARAKRIHPEWPEDMDDQLFTIEDQFSGALDEHLNAGNKVPDRLKHKLHCVAAMCIRTLENLESE